MRPHLKALYRLAYRLTGNGADAEDLLQDVLVKLYRKIDDLRGIEKRRPWLARVLYTQFIDTKRRAARSPLYLAVDNNDEESPVPVDMSSAPFNEPEAAVIRHVDQQALIKALDRLSEDHRMIIMLSDVEGYTFSEMETILGCPQGTLKSRLHRARARLRDLFSGKVKE
jgi:RNA polymerase sigma-70 factor (ECF subfamily)